MQRAALLLLCGLFAVSASAHDKAYWKSILESKYAVPTGERPFALAQELTELLGSPDPELRDQIAFSILNAWLTGDTPFTEEELIALANEWQSNLRSDTVLKRSFSALSLASLAERDLTKPFLDEVRYRTLLDASLTYLTSERDLRGFDGDQGWIHATAHTADLIAVLARNRHFTRADQKRVWTAIADRLSSATEVFTQGEQDRLAQAVTAVVVRKDFDAAAFNEWLTNLRAAKRAAARTRPMTSMTLAKYQNPTYFLQALYVRLSIADAPARATVLDALR